jgi:subtilisin family serine protease
MTKRGSWRWLGMASAVFVLAALLGGFASAAPQGSKHRYIVVVRNAADYDAIKAKAQQLGGKVVSEIREIHALVIVASSSARDGLAADGRTQGVALDHVEQIAPAERQAPNLDKPGLLGAKTVNLKAPAAQPGRGSVNPDPAFDNAGLMWDYDRIHAQDAWAVTTGTKDVTVGVADTGIDYTHQDLKTNVKKVIDFTVTEDPPLCLSEFGLSDQDFANHVGGPANGDWHGHGTWIAGNIASTLDGLGVNGIAPKVRLVSLKISQWCGSAYDSTILTAFVRAAKLKIDVVSISFGGYLDRSDPSQDLIWQSYVDAVAFAKEQGTVIVSSAGNEHAQISTDGLVTSHGILTSPVGTFVDYFGWYEVPAGIPGVVDVASTGNKVVATSPTCPPGTMGSDTDPNATCKPQVDPHQPNGQSQQDQLAYYSNYGSRIDVAAPGGARKYNLPLWDRGGTPGFPVTDADLTTAWETFSTTSNFATGITCYKFTQGSGFYPGQCYAIIQGTSMATPHVSAVLALIASARPDLQHNVDALIAFMKGGARAATNTTPVLSATDTSGGDLGGIYGVDCVSGYCHLGGAVISSAEAYGAGIVDASVILP